MKSNLIPDTIEYDVSLLPGFNEDNLPLLNQTSQVKKIKYPLDSILCIDNILNNEEIKNLKNAFNNHTKYTATNESIKIQYGSVNNGIQRSCCYDKKFSQDLFQRVSHYLNEYEVYENEKYQLVGMNPLIKFIFYQKGHKLIPHYDKLVNINKQKHITTLKTLIIYLNQSESGSTNFLLEKKINNFSKDFSILHSQYPEEGVGIIFNHGVLHESGLIKNNDVKLILTTDICYQRIKP